jgi:hypothetical protein
MSRSDARESPGLGFNHGTEIIATEGALLLQIGTNHQQGFVGQNRMKQRLVLCKKSEPDPVCSSREAARPRRALRTFIRSMLLLLYQLFHMLVAFQRLDLRVAEQAVVVSVLDGFGDGWIAQDSLDLRVGL